MLNSGGFSPPCFHFHELSCVCFISFFVVVTLLVLRRASLFDILGEERFRIVVLVRALGGVQPRKYV